MTKFLLGAGIAGAIAYLLCRGTSASDGVAGFVERIQTGADAVAHDLGMSSGGGCGCGGGCGGTAAAAPSAPVVVPILLGGDS